jgi:hypothetical protein
MQYRMLTNELFISSSSELHAVSISSATCLVEVDPAKLAPCELIRRKKLGLPLEDEQPSESAEDRGPVTWPGKRLLQSLACSEYLLTT